MFAYYVIVNTDCMVGDVNLFLNDSEDNSVAELDVMIAGMLVFHVEKCWYWNVPILNIIVNETSLNGHLS